MDTDKLILKFIWKGKRSRISHTIQNKKSIISRLTWPDFKSKKYSNQDSVIDKSTDEQVTGTNKEPRDRTT